MSSVVVSHYIVDVLRKDGDKVQGYLYPGMLPGEVIKEKMICLFDEIGTKNPTLIAINRDCIDTIEFEQVNKEN